MSGRPHVPGSGAAIVAALVAAATAQGGEALPQTNVMLPQPGPRRVDKWRRNKPSAQRIHGSRSDNKYKPHHGSRECERRRRQMARDRGEL